MKWSFAPAIFILAALAITPVAAQFIETAGDPPPSAKGLDLPVVVDLISGNSFIDEASSDGANGFIKNKAAAIILGKALFWDMQAGSDDVGCATCHYHAGVDNRFQNQLSPGLNGGNAVFDPTNTGGGGPNEVLQIGDFPFHELTDLADRDSVVLFDTDDTVSSAGTFAGDFVDIVPGQSKDVCVNNSCHPEDPDGFSVNNINTRRVEPRNTPTVINAAFNHRNFWDGRANNIFNGVDGFGQRNTDARVLEVQGANVAPIQIALENASLASQSVVPPISDFEMACTGRTFPKIGKKLLSLAPLALQEVHTGDSVLGFLSASPAKGLNFATYQSLIELAIADRFWDSNKLFDANNNEIGMGVPANTNEFTLTEANFSLIWGLAIMVYERTLISDDALYDQWAEAPGGLSFEASNHKGLMTQAQMRGMRLFFTNELVPGTEKKGLRGNCSTCHQGPLFTTATFPFTEEEESGEFPEQEVIIERMLRGDGIHIAEDLMRFFVSGQGTVGGYTLDGRAGSWEMPNIYRATVGGDFTVNGSACIVESYLMNQDRTQPPPAPMEGVAPEPPGPSDFADYSTKDAVFRVTGCGGGPDGLEITIVDNGAGNDTATIRELVAIGLPGSAICPECYDIPPIYGATLASGAIDGDFTLEIPTLYDTAFYNIGVRPTAEDLGIGTDDPFGIPLSFTQQWIHQILYEDAKVGDIENLKSINFGRIHNPFNWYGDSVWFPAGFQGYTWMTHRLVANGNYPDEFCVNPFPPFLPAPPPYDVADQPTCEGAGFQWNIVPEFSLTPGIAAYFFLERPGRGDDAVPLYEPVQRMDGFATIPMNVQNYQAIVDMPTAMGGAFKVPNLRNISLTGPFFHNGGTLTLGQVVEFYNRGGDFAMENLGDTAPNIHPLNLDTGQIADIVAFLEAFTDERVRCEQGPFDHPEIIISRGHTGDTNNVVDDGTGRQAAEDFEEVIPASGAAGLAPANCLKGFLE